MPIEFNHILKSWEISHHRLVLGEKLPRGLRFDMKIGDEALKNRLVDKGGRIWVGSAISKYQIGQVFKVTINDSKSEVILEPI